MKMAYGKSHKRLAEIKSKPGLSNSGEYKGLVTAGPHGTYPLNMTKGGPISPRRVRAALSLGHHLGSKGEAKLRKNIGSILQRKGKMQGLANRLLHGDKRSK
jgi:hypothetical protein